MINYQFFPRSHGMSSEMQAVLNCFESVADKIDSGVKSLKSNDVLAVVAPALREVGFLVENGKHKDEMIDVPVLFGLNNKVDKSFYADAVSIDGKIVIEVEAGRAVKNNQFLKDIFQACMMHNMEYLVLAVQNTYNFKSKGKTMTSKDFQEIYTFLETLYISNRLHLPLKGILLIGY